VAWKDEGLRHSVEEGTCQVVVACIVVAAFVALATQRTLVVRSVACLGGRAFAA
jgi:hypothetical protein